MDIAFHLYWWIIPAVLAGIGAIVFAAIGGEPFGNPGPDVEWQAIRAGLFWWVPALCICLGHWLQ